MKARYVWKIAFIWSVCSYQQRPASKWKCSELTHILQTSIFAFEFAGSYILSGNDLWNIILALVSIAMCDGYKLEPEECFQTNGTQDNNFTDSGNYNSLVMEWSECLSWTLNMSSSESGNMTDWSDRKTKSTTGNKRKVHCIMSGFLQFDSFISSWALFAIANFPFNTRDHGLLV